MTINLGTTPESYCRGNLRVCRRGKKGSIVVAAMTRPKVKNAFHDPLYEDLIDLMHETATDASVSAIVLTGAGSYFSSGADVREAFQQSQRPAKYDILHQPTGKFMLALIAYPKIFAMAVQGPAVGIGVTILMHADLVHCSDKATLWVPFTRLALVPELCSSVTFAESMGLSKANELLLLGRKIDAQTALEWNICSQVIKGCDSSGDPFHPNSLASRMSNEIDQRLLDLPLGQKTAEYFVSLIKGSRRQRMGQICLEELRKLGDRFNSGQVSYAARQLQFGSSSKEKGPQQQRSKL